ncbi:unnamed protein product [Victoria cruziana]
MTEFSEIEHLHVHLLTEEDNEEDEALDLSLQLAYGGYDVKNRPSGGGGPESVFPGDDLPGSPGKGLIRDCAVVQNSTEEPSSVRHLHQVDLNLGLSDHSSSSQFDSMTDSSVGSLSSVGSGFCEGEDDMGSYYLGLGLGSDDGDWGCFWANNYPELYVDHVGPGPEGRENPHVDGVCLAEEELGAGHPVGLVQNSVSGSVMVESGDSSMTLGAQSDSPGALACEDADLVDIDGNSCRNDDACQGIECFGVVEMETDSDEEEFLDPQDDGSPIVGRRSGLGMDNRSESDASVHDVDYQLCWDCLHLCEQSDSDEDYEWEEVDGGGMDTREVPAHSDSALGESTSDDIFVHRVLPEVLDLHESSGVEVADTETNLVDFNDALEAAENLDWAVLVDINSLGTSDYDVDAHGAPVQIHGNEPALPAEVFEILAGQFTNNEGLPRGTQPASKCFVSRLPSVSLMDENSDGWRSVCAVCKDEVSREELVKQLPCSHCYHSSCILPWLSIRSTCPVCRYQLPTDDPDYEQRRMQNPQ